MAFFLSYTRYSVIITLYNFYMDYHIFLVFVHILGAVVGMGGAIMSDLIFLLSIRDEKVSHTEMRFLRLGGRVVWVGLGIIVISGALLFFEHPDRYLESSKFLAKMTIVGILIINGIFFHAVHIPRLHRHIGVHFPSSDEFMRAVPLLLISGTVSVVSWGSALLLGVSRRLSYTYPEIMGVYVLVLLCAIIVALFLRKKIIPHTPVRE